MSRKLNEQTFCGWCGSKLKYETQWQSVCTQCGYVTYFNPLPSCNVLITHGDAVLMLRRALEPSKGKYDFPGGFMDMTDNSLEDNVYREVFEETNIAKKDLSLPTYLGSVTSTYVLQDTERLALNCYFICELRAQKEIIAIDRSEVSGMHWTRSKDLSTIDFALEPDKTMLMKYFGGK